jgi:hypothetical protein
MVVQGRPRAEVEKFVRDNEMSPNEANLTELYKYRASPDFQKWQRANPGASLPLDPKYYTREVPMSQIRQDFNKGAASGPGGAIDSYLANAAGSLSGNHLDDLAGEQANTGMDLLRQQHPGFALAGDASGQVMFDLLASKVPGLRALPSKRFGQAGLDAIYGGYSGQGEGDTLGGIGSNIAGGMLGRGVAKLGGAALRGVSSPSLSYLNSRDVPLTIGQIGRGSGTVAGNVVSGIEDRMAGFRLPTRLSIQRAAVASRASTLRPSAKLAALACSAPRALASWATR